MSMSITFSSAPHKVCFMIRQRLSEISLLRHSQEKGPRLLSGVKYSSQRLDAEFEKKKKRRRGHTQVCGDEHFIRHEAR